MGSGVADRLEMLVVDISDKKKCKTKNRAHRLAAVQLQLHMEIVAIVQTLQLCI